MGIGARDVRMHQRRALPRPAIFRGAPQNRVARKRIAAVAFLHVKARDNSPPVSKCCRPPSGIAPERKSPSRYPRSRRAAEVSAGRRNSALRKIRLRWWNRLRRRRRRFRPPGGAHARPAAPAAPAPAPAETARNRATLRPCQRPACTASRSRRTAEEYSAGECPSAKASAARRNSDRPWLPPPEGTFRAA